MKKLKVLKQDLTSPYKNFKYEIGKEYVCEDFDEDKEKPCSNGFYATDIEGLPYSWNVNYRCFEVEVSGKQVIFDQYKQRFEKQTIIREVFKDELIELAKAEEKRLGYILSEILFPVNPFLIKTKDVTTKEIELLKQWVSVRASVGTSVRASVKDSIGTSVMTSVWDSVGTSVGTSVSALVKDSVWASVGTSVGALVGDSVWASFRAYISSLFPNIKKWKYIEHKKGKNPFQPCIDLWRTGFVPSFDGKTWKLHSGEEAKIVYQLT